LNLHAYYAGLIPFKLCLWISWSSNVVWRGISVSTVLDDSVKLSFGSVDPWTWFGVCVNWISMHTMLDDSVELSFGSVDPWTLFHVESIACYTGLIPSNVCQIVWRVCWIELCMLFANLNGTSLLSLLLVVCQIEYPFCFLGLSNFRNIGIMLAADLP
jgi:hypothetical protein